MKDLINYLIEPSPDVWPSIFKRPTVHHNIKDAVVGILKHVQENGDNALTQLTERFDGVRLSDFKVMIPSSINIDQNLSLAIDQAMDNISKYHSLQEEKLLEVETMPGIYCKQISRPIQKVGIYIPGGTAPLLSTLMMLGIPAKIAGCQDIIVCTPPNKDGKIHEAILYIARKLGLEKIFCIGGAQAIAAMAYGTETIPKVSKIFGPGNSFVTYAKEMIQAEGVAIDMPAGPSELMIIADDTSIPDFVAADLLSQAEHGIDSQVICLAQSEDLATKIIGSLRKQLPHLPRKEIALKALEHSSIIVEPNQKKWIQFMNEYAPEHLILACKNAEDILPEIQNAGSIFLGNWSAESIGDYASGPNHTLPTNGHAKAYSGITLDAFKKKMSVQNITSSGFKNIADTVETLAEAEQLIAHKMAITIRKKYLENE